MQKLLEYITREITGNEKIEVGMESLDPSSNSGLNIYTIKAPKEVMGILIGKSGRTIRAIRSLARARAIKENENISVELQEVA